MDMLIALLGIQPSDIAEVGDGQYIINYALHKKKIKMLENDGFTVKISATPFGLYGAQSIDGIEKTGIDIHQILSYNDERPY